MAVKDLPHNLAFTTFPLWGPVYSGIKRRQTADVIHNKAYKSPFNTFVSSYANLSLNKIVCFFLHFHLQSQGKYDLGKWPLFCS